MKRILFIAMLLAGVLLPQPANARKWLGGDISMLRANEQAGVVYRDILGNEVKGVSQQVVDASDLCIEIPQQGTKHSLNISCCAAIVMWYVYQSNI